MMKINLYVIIFKLTVLSVRKCDDFFEGIADSDNELNNLITFSPGNYSFTLLDRVLYNNTDYSLSLNESITNIPDLCGSSYLNKSQLYNLITLPIETNSVFTSVDVQLPFSDVLNDNLPFINSNFCLAFNEKNLAIGFTPIEFNPYPTQNSTIVISKILLSNENSLEVDNFDNFEIYDTIRYYQVNGLKQFAMNMMIGIPSLSTDHDYYEFDSSRGFYYNIKTDLQIISSIDNLDDISLKMKYLNLNLRLNESVLISLKNLREANGLLRDSKNYSCYQNGLYLSTDKNDINFYINTDLLSTFFGTDSLEFTQLVHLGLFLDIRNDENNGFFIQGNVKSYLFETFKVPIFIEIQMLNNIEINKRLNSLNDSNCSSESMSEVNNFIFDIFEVNNSNNSNLWSDYFEDLYSSKFYFIMYFKTTKSFRFPLMNNIKFLIKNDLDGYILMPSPINGEYLYAVLQSEAEFNDLNVNCEWIIRDEQTFWNCKSQPNKLKKYDQINFEILSSSDWFYKKQKLISIPKNFNKISINFNRSELAKALIESLEKFILKILSIWLTVIKSIETLRKEAVELIAPYCQSPPCNIVELIRKFDNSYAMYQKTNKIYKKLFDNEFNCPIYEEFFRSCQNLGTVCVYLERVYVFQPCMERVRGILIEARKKEELADWKEKINDLNILLNIGLRYVLEEIVLERDPFNENDIQIDESIFTFNPRDESLYEKINNFDDYEPYKPFDDSDVDIDMNDVYSINQNLNLALPIVIETTRLSNTIKGKDNTTVKFNLNGMVDFMNEETLARSVENIFKQLVDEEGLLFKAVLGNNVGITDDLISVYGMNPPVIKLDSPLNPTLYCNDPKIDQYYNEDENKVLEEIRKMLSRVTIDQIFTKCKNNIDYQDIANCTQHESICGATRCVFKRFIFDGCGQKSNEVYEEAIILPRKPFFKNFPNNLVLSCDENKRVIDNFQKFILPETQSGCRNVRTNLRYDDLLINNTCSESIFRKWIVEVVGCENFLFESRNQKLYIDDKFAPVFSFMPKDTVIDFFEPYGSDNLGTPKVYDTCGHGSSSLSYKDYLDHVDNGKRVINRVWQTQDRCGNKHEEVQIITVKNSNKNDLGSNFKNFVLFSFNETILTNSIVHGPLASKDKINLINSTIGNDEDFEEKCIKRQKWTVLSGKRVTIDDSLIHGSVKSMSDFDFNKAYEQAVSLSNYFNDGIRLINVGPREINCFESVRDTSMDFPLINYLESDCTLKSYNYFKIHSIDESKLDMNKIERIELIGTELIYNVFFFKEPKLLENKEIRLNVSQASIVVINILNKSTFNLNKHKIRFDLAPSINLNKIIFNFLSNGDIVFDESEEYEEINGTILAPYSNFIKISRGKNIKFLNGQLFAKNIFIDGLKQECALFESFLD